jgi:hypothetical protein
MLNGARLTDSLQKGLWAECANCATVNKTLPVSPTTETPSYERFFGEPSKLIWNLKTRLKIQEKSSTKESMACFLVMLQTMHQMCIVS